MSDVTSISCPEIPICIAFAGQRRLAAGSPGEVALAVKAALAADDRQSILVFDGRTGRPIDFDLRGDAAAILARLAPAEAAAATDGTRQQDRGIRQATRPGRPKLGVVAREVTLLPRHWDWLAGQPGGASVALRKLVEAARRQGTPTDDRRQAREAAYRFMSAMLGNEIGFEEASRALFADERNRFTALTAGWPADPRQHLLEMAAACFTPADERILSA